MFLFVISILFFFQLPHVIEAEIGILPYYGNEINIPDFPENIEARKKMENIIFAPKSVAINYRGYRSFNQRIENHRVVFKVVRQKDAFYLLFTNEKDFDFPVYSRGSYIIKRNRKDGSFLQCKIFLGFHAESAVRLYPEGNRTRLTVRMFGKQIYKDVMIPVEFKSLLVSPFSRIIRLTNKSINWKVLLQVSDYKDTQNIYRLVKDIRKFLPKMNDAEDGAQNENGEFVFINDGSVQGEKGGFNCSGFAKWIIDGLCYPEIGRYLSLEKLKKRHPDLRGNGWSETYEKERDPYFGLDWTRNLAVQAADALYAAETPSTESMDVRNVPFMHYTEDIGYPVEDIRLILFLLTAMEPGQVYLGSINREYGKGPQLRQHVHVVVFLPYITAAGDFKISVMERHTETSVESLLDRYGKNFVHLVKIKGFRQFFPPSVE